MFVLSSAIEVYAQISYSAETYQNTSMAKVAKTTYDEANEMATAQG